MYNYCQIDLPTLNMHHVALQSATVTQTRYAHDVLSVKLKNWDVKFDAVTTGTPVKVILQGNGSKKEYVGYVHHIKPDVSPTKNYVEIDIIGASFPMKQQGQKTWSNTTASNVVKELAKKHRLDFDIEPHPRVYPHITQGGLSDWELCAKLAKQCGYTFKVDGTTLHFEPITKRFTEERESAKAFSMGTLEAPTATSIYSFKPLLGDNLHVDGETNGAVAVHGTDAVLKKEHSYTNQSKKTTAKAKSPTQLFDRHETRVVAPSMAAAKFEQDAAKERSRFLYRAHAELYGDPSLTPNTPVYLDNVGSDYSGYWVVLSVEHHVEGHKFVSSVELGTDSLGQPTTWVDGKNVSQPNSGVRVVKKGKPNYPKRDTTYLLQMGNSGGSSTKNHFGATKNVPIQKVSNGRVAPIAVWSASRSDVNMPQLSQKAVPTSIKESVDKRSAARR